MKRLGYLLQKEFLQIFRNRSMVFIIIMMPVVQLLIMPWATTFEQKNISLCVVDNDRSSSSRELIDKITSSGYFILTEYAATYSEALDAVEKNKADVILEIPPRWEVGIIREQRTDFMMSINAVNGQKGGVALSYLTRVINDYLQDMLAELPIEKMPQVVLKPYYRYNAGMEYFQYMVPGIFAILITVMTGLLGAQNIVREKEIGTIEQLNVTPLPKILFILGKVIPFWIIGFIIMTLGMIIAWLMYDVVPEGSIGAIYLYAAFYIIAFTGIGILISNIASTQQQAWLITFFFLMLCILLSGLFTPVSSMPGWAQTITVFNPMRYFVEVLRLVYLKGSGLADIVPQLWKTFIFVLFFNGMAILTYRKRTG